MTPIESEDQPKRTLISKLPVECWIGSPLLLTFFFVYCHNVTTSYQAVSDDSKLPWSGKDKVYTPQAFIIFPPDHLVQDGKLYLRVQTVRQLILLNGVNLETWDGKRIAAFRAWITRHFAGA